MGDDAVPFSFEKIEPAGEPGNSNKGFTGKGKATYPNGDTYEGMYKDGKRWGPGKYTYKKTNDVYTGDFEDNQKTGLARYNFGKPSTGEEGEGEAPSSANAGFYHGNFVNGKRDGEGTMKFPNGDIYSGFWKSGKKHGKGTYVYMETKFQLVGEWDQGEIKNGRWVWTNGAQYIGAFQANEPSGFGLWKYANGYEVEGNYVRSEDRPLDWQTYEMRQSVPA